MPLPDDMHQQMMGERSTWELQHIHFSPQLQRGRIEAVAQQCDPMQGELVKPIIERPLYDLLAETLAPMLGVWNTNGELAASVLEVEAGWHEVQNRDWWTTRSEEVILWT